MMIKPKLIKTWKELAELPPSKTHRIDIDTGYSGWVCSLDETDKRPLYLSTHTFYGKGQHKFSTKLLQSCGFNVEIDNWDAEQEGKNQ